MHRWIARLGLFHSLLDWVGLYLALLGLRLVLAWEFWESAHMKITGANWFHEIQSQFPFPFSIVPPEISWNLAMVFETAGAVALLVGLATRYFAIALLVLDLVAWYAVHAGLGYNVCDNGWKLPLLYAVMLVPFILRGAGRLSLDHWIGRRLGLSSQ